MYDSPTFDTIRTLLVWVASPIGAAAAAAWLFAQLRQLVRKPTAADWRTMTPSARWVARALYDKRAARVVVFVMTGLLAALGSIGTALLLGDDWRVALDAALAGPIGIVMNQLMHARIMPQPWSFETEETP